MPRRSSGILLPLQPTLGYIIVVDAPKGNDPTQQVKGQVGMIEVDSLNQFGPLETTTRFLLLPLIRIGRRLVQVLSHVEAGPLIRTQRLLHRNGR